MATQRPVPTPSGSLDCKPCGAPPRLGAVEGGQCGLLGDWRGGIVRSYSLAEKSLEQVQTRYGKAGWTTIAVISWSNLSINENCLANPLNVLPRRDP